MSKRPEDRSLFTLLMAVALVQRTLLGKEHVLDKYRPNERPHWDRTDLVIIMMATGAKSAAIT